MKQFMEIYQSCLSALTFASKSWRLLLWGPWSIYYIVNYSKRVTENLFFLQCCATSRCVAQCPGKLHNVKMCCLRELFSVMFLFCCLPWYWKLYWRWRKRRRTRICTNTKRPPLWEGPNSEYVLSCMLIHKYNIFLVEKQQFSVKVGMVW